MTQFDNTMLEFVNLDYDSLLELAKKSIKSLHPICKAIDPENDGVLLLSSIVLSAIGTDRRLSEKERQFLSDTLSFNSREIDEYFSLYSPEMENLVDAFADEISEDTKLHVVTLVCAIAACDETISCEESAFIKKLLA